MKIKIKDFTGAQLDWAVAKCEGYVLTSDGISNLLVRENEMLLLGPGSSPINYSPSYYWMQGGEIIERERLQLIAELGDEMWACSSPKAVEIGRYRKYCFASGPTPLIAAMRCYCSFKLGDEVDVPEELCK